jgi:insulysin
MFAALAAAGFHHDSSLTNAVELDGYENVPVSREAVLRNYLRMETSLDKPTKKAGPKADASGEVVVDETKIPDYPGLNNTGDATIEAGEMDQNKYANIRLPNGLEVLLISDPDTGKAACSVDVGVGYFNDPADVAGLAHFLEHMLFLGSKKYPAENAFESYIQKHGGSNNAYTSMENTNYYFDIFPAFLKDGLDHFAQFFIAPLLSVDNTDREMNAVNAEHRKNIESDGWRSMEIKRHVADPSAPFSKFGTGSVETLGKHPKERLREELVKLWTEFYTAGNIRLVVLGGHELKTLALWVSQAFAGVRQTTPAQPAHSRAVAYNSTHASIYNATLTGAAVYFAPVRREQTLTMQWPVPSQVSRYDSNAASYITRMIESEGPGTLYSQLRARGWVSALNAGLSVNAHTFGLFAVEATLTPVGVHHADEIIAAVYQLVALIRAGGVEHWRHDEMSKLARLNFDWRAKSVPRKIVSSLSASMRWHRREHILSGAELFHAWSAADITDMLSHLTPEKMTLFVSAPQVESLFGVTLDRFEHNYGIKFAYRAFSVEQTQLWARFSRPGQVSLLDIKDPTARLQLPRANQWVPSKEAFRLKPYYDLRSGAFVSVVDDRSAVHIAPPAIIYERDPAANGTAGDSAAGTGAARVWFKQDATFDRPTVAIKLRFWTAAAAASPKAAATAMLYSKVVDDLLQDWVFHPGQCGYRASLTLSRQGATLTISGYTEGLLAFIRGVASHMAGERFAPTAQRFEVLREAALEAVANARFRVPYKYARALSNLVLAEAFPVSELAPAITALTLDDVLGWPRSLLADTRLEALIQGNIYAWQAREFVEETMRVLPYTTVKASFAPAAVLAERASLRHPVLDGRYTAATVALDEHEPNSMVYNVYQHGRSNSTLDKLYLEVLDHYLRKSAYNALRTQEQLGYIVWAYGTSSGDVSEVVVQVQSANFAPAYVDARVQTFLANYRAQLDASVTPKGFAKTVMTLYDAKLNNATTLGEESQEYWGAIESQKYNFLQRFVDAQLLLRKLTISGLFDFYDRVFGMGPYSGKSLSIQIASHAHAKASPAGAPIAAAPARFPPHRALPEPSGAPWTPATQPDGPTAAPRGDAPLSAGWNATVTTERKRTVHEYLILTKQAADAAAADAATKAAAAAADANAKAAIANATTPEAGAKAAATQVAPLTSTNLTAIDAHTAELEKKIADALVAKINAESKANETKSAQEVATLEKKLADVNKAVTAQASNATTAAANATVAANTTVAAAKPAAVAVLVELSSDADADTEIVENQWDPAALAAAAFAAGHSDAVSTVLGAVPKPASTFVRRQRIARDEADAAAAALAPAAVSGSLLEAGTGATLSASVAARIARARQQVVSSLLEASVMDALVAGERASDALELRVAAFEAGARARAAVLLEMQEELSGNYVEAPRIEYALEAETEAQAEAEEVVMLELGTEIDLEAETEAEFEAELDAEAEEELDIEAALDADLAADAAAEAEAEAEAAAEAEAESAASLAAETEAETEYGPVAIVSSRSWYAGRRLIKPKMVKRITAPREHKRYVTPEGERFGPDDVAEPVDPPAPVVPAAPNATASNTTTGNATAGNATAGNVTGAANGTTASGNGTAGNASVAPVAPEPEQPYQVRPDPPHQRFKYDGEDTEANVTTSVVFAANKTEKHAIKVAGLAKMKEQWFRSPFAAAVAVPQPIIVEATPPANVRIIKSADEEALKLAVKVAARSAARAAGRAINGTDANGNPANGTAANVTAPVVAANATAARVAANATAPVAANVVPAAPAAGLAKVNVTTAAL